MNKFLDEMNLHERRDFEKIRLHKCENCGHEYKGWVSDNLQNTYLTSFCTKCDHKNLYYYWGAAAYEQNKKRELLPNLPNSTENLSKIADKDEWLNEVRGNEVLSEMQKAWIAAGLNPQHYSAACADAMKIYSDSKLSELEKWIDENVFEEASAYLVYSPELKAKIKSLK